MTFSGLSSAEASTRRKTFGKNTIQTAGTTSLFILFLLQFPSVINGILLCGAVFSFFISDKLDGFFILISILLNSLFGFVQEYRAEKSLEKLKSYAAPTSRVLRDGREQQLSSEELVPDDIVILSEGDRIPADGVILSSQHMEVEESILTGESLPVIKSDSDSLYLGTLLTKGKGILKVTKTGMQTEFGQIASSLATIENSPTPLQLKLSSLGKVLTLLILILSSLVIPLGVFYHRNILQIILLAVSIGVSAIPEGLPAVITIALAIGTSRMAKRAAIVKKMQAVETLGEVQVLLVDKTGTLTENSMRVKKYFLHKKAALLPLLMACVLGNTASLVQKAKRGDFDILGDKTDGALLLWAMQLHPQIPDHIQQGEIKDEYVFESSSKTITTTWKYKDHIEVFVRGAPEVLLQKSVLSPQERETIEKEYQLLAKEGLRVIACATKKEKHSSLTRREHVENHLTFLGLIGIADPAREEIKGAIHQTKKAGIRTIMVTGDNELTAVAIGKEIGLILDGTDVLTSDELQKASDEEVLRLLPTVSIIARATPHDKLRMATLLQKQGYIVGVTGDGVNDALALKKADVGIAMGHSGTDVAKEAADIILVNDNFTTLLRAIEEGRVIYQNIFKAITYLLTSNLSELLLVTAGVAFNLPTVLLPTQILWINIITDGLPAIALATDTKDPTILNHPPRDHNAPLIGLKKALQMIFIGTTLAGALLSLYLFLLPLTSVGVARSILFNALIFSHLLLAYLLRGKVILKKNHLLLIACILTTILQTLIMTLPFFREIFHIEL